MRCASFCFPENPGKLKTISVVYLKGTVFLKKADSPKMLFQKLREADFQKMFFPKLREANL